VTEQVHATYSITQDVAANRPATPSGATLGKLIIYEATDTGVVSFWINGLGWVSAGGGSAASYNFTASEALVVGLVNLWDSSGNFRVRKADQSLQYDASGFVLATVSNGGTATVYFSGSILSGLSGLTPGKMYLNDAGLLSSTPGTTMLQEVGYALTATSMIFMPKASIVL
jgi:hypothetical protein